MAGKLGSFLWKALMGLVLVAAAMVAISFVIGLIKAALSLAALLLVGYVVWRILVK